MGARDEHTLRAFIEAEAYDGPSIIIAYSHCIAHGINMNQALDNQKAAVATGQWLLYRYNPARAAQGQNPLTLDRRPKGDKVEKFLDMENRFRQLKLTKPEEARRLYAEAQEDVDRRVALYERLAADTATDKSKDSKPAAGPETK
jgi:pyruvate-ferredoxin/flavodoxin oxidoreductase